MFRADIAVAVFPGGLQDSFEAAPTVSLAMLPAAATKPGVGWRHVTEAGLCSSVFEAVKGSCKKSSTHDPSNTSHARG